MKQSRRNIVASALSLPLLVFPTLHAPVFADQAEEGVICSLTKPIFNLPHEGAHKDAHIEAHQAVNWIMAEVGLSPNFTVGHADFDQKVGAYAVISKRQRRIVYDTAYFTWVEGSPNWRETGIMAHEIGHHLAGHTAGIRTSSHAQELEADRFAGFALGRLGATLSQATRWTQDLSEDGSSSHPPRRQRIIAASDGWRLGASEK